MILFIILTKLELLYLNLTKQVTPLAQGLFIRIEENLLAIPQAIQIEQTLPAIIQAIQNEQTLLAIAQAIQNKQTLLGIT